MENQSIDRNFNFALLRYLRGRHEGLVKDLRGIAHNNEISDFALGRRKISEHRARAIEAQLKLPDRWLDRNYRTLLKMGTEDYRVLELVHAVSPEVRDAIKTILEVGNRAFALDQVNNGTTGAKLSLVRSGGAAAGAQI